MKKLIIALAVLLATALFAAEAVPEYVTLTIRDGHVCGVNFESARTPVVRTSLRGDLLDVDIQTEFQGGGHAFAAYDFLRFGDTSMKNLTVTLCFEKDSAGTFRLKDVY